MTENLITYGIFIILGILVIFSFSIGIKKMIKIILGNYILSSICLAGSQSIHIAVNNMKQSPESTILWLSFSKFANFLEKSDTVIILISYIILFIIVYKTSKIKIRLPDDEAIKKIVQIIFVPLTIISIILTLQIIFLWMDNINIAGLWDTIATITSNPYIIKFINFTPVWILLHGIATILITSEFKVKVETDI